VFLELVLVGNQSCFKVVNHLNFLGWLGVYVVLLVRRRSFISNFFISFNLLEKVLDLSTGGKDWILSRHSAVLLAKNIQLQLIILIIKWIIVIDLDRPRLTLKKSLLHNSNELAIFCVVFNDLMDDVLAANEF
jgi:hypothetical protein